MPALRDLSAPTLEYLTFLGHPFHCYDSHIRNATIAQGVRHRNDDGTTAIGIRPPIDPTAMRCTICHRPSSSALPFNCTACARDTLYQTRISIAHALLEHEAAGSQVEQTLKTFPSTQIKLPALASSIPQLHPPSLALDSTSVHREAVSQQNQLMLQGSKLLREEAARIRDEIASRKDRNLARKIELIAARKELARREAVDVASPEKAAARVRNRWDTLHNRTAESRLVLCKEAASLYGLEKQSTCDAGLATDVYFIGGLPIYNLKDLNSKSTTVLLRLMLF